MLKHHIKYLMASYVYLLSSMYNFSRNFGLLAAKMYSHIIYYYVTGTKISAGFLNVDINTIMNTKYA